MALSLRTERAFRNSFALSYLLVGLALLAFSLGGVLQFAADYARGTAEVNNWLVTAPVLAIVALYLMAGVLLIRNRPKNWSATAQPAYLAAPTLLRCAQVVAFVFMLLGVLMVVGETPYGRDGTLAAMLLMFGIFTLIGAVLYNRLDVNVRAAASILGILAAIVLLAAQLRFNYAGAEPGTYGAWETTSLVVPRVFGPIAFLIVGVAGLVFTYARKPRPEFGSYFILSLAGLVYGMGLMLATLAFFFDTPWSRFVDVRGTPLYVLGALTAGGLLLLAAGTCILAASIIGFIRNGQGIADAGYVAPAQTGTPTSPPAKTTTTTVTNTRTEGNPPQTTRTQAQKTTVERTPPTT